MASFPWGYLSAQRPPRTLLTHSDSGEQPFGHIGHNDANQEDDSIQPAVAQDKREWKKRDAKEDGDSCDQMDEVFDFSSDGGLA